MPQKIDYDDYILPLLGDYFRMGTKNTNCEANIYLHPPNEETDPTLYQPYRGMGQVFKDIFWSYYWIRHPEKKWQESFLNTRPKYSLHVCEIISKDSTCYNTHHSDEWNTSALALPNALRVYEILMVLLTYSDHRELYAVCVYCDPCDPFKLAL